MHPQLIFVAPLRSCKRRSLISPPRCVALVTLMTNRDDTAQILVNAIKEYKGDTNSAAAMILEHPERFVEAQTVDMRDARTMAAHARDIDKRTRFQKADCVERYA